MIPGAYSSPHARGERLPLPLAFGVLRYGLTGKASRVQLYVPLAAGVQRPATDAAGALVTLELAVLSMLIGIALGVVLAVMRGSSSRILNAIAATWVEVARNTPACFRFTSPISGSASLASV